MSPTPSFNQLVANALPQIIHRGVKEVNNNLKLIVYL